MGRRSMRGTTHDTPEDAAGENPSAEGSGASSPAPLEAEYELAVAGPTRGEVSGLMLAGYIALLGCVLVVARPAVGAGCLILAVFIGGLSGLPRAYQLTRLHFVLSKAAQLAVVKSRTSPRVLSDAGLRQAKRALTYWSLCTVIDRANPSLGPHVRVQFTRQNMFLYWCARVLWAVASSRSEDAPGRLRRAVARVRHTARKMYTLMALSGAFWMAVWVGVLLFLAVAGPGSSLEPLWPAMVALTLAALFLPTQLVWWNFHVALHRGAFRVAAVQIRIGASTVEERIATFRPVADDLELDVCIAALAEEQADRRNNRAWGAVFNGLVLTAVLLLALAAWRSQNHEPVNWRSPNTTIRAACFLVAGVFLTTSVHAWKRRRRIAASKYLALELTLKAWEELPPAMRSWARALSEQIGAFQEDAAFGASFATTIGSIVGVLAILVALAPTSARADLVTTVVEIKNALTSP